MKEADQRFLIAAAGAGAVALAAAVSWRRYTRSRGSQVPAGQGVRVGLIGTGWAVRVQLPQFRRAGLDVTAIASRSQDHAVSLAAQHHIANPFSDVVSLCQSSEVDLVSVVTPPYLHAEQMIAALVGGKHVLVDKPMARSAAEAERMHAAAVAHSKQVAIVDHELRFTAAFLRARELLREGAIGTVAFVEVATFMPGLGPKWSWWSDEVSGGGVLGAVGSHIIDVHRFLLDCEFGSVSAHLETVVRQREDDTTGQPRACTADDYASIQFKLEPRKGTEDALVWGPDASVQGHMVMALVGSPSADATTMKIIGTRGSIEIDLASSSMIARENATGSQPGAATKVLASVKMKGSAFAVDGTHGLGVALQRALGPEQDRAALRNAATIADGLAVTYVLDAAHESSNQHGAWQTPQHVQTVMEHAIAI